MRHLLFPSILLLVLITVTPTAASYLRYRGYTIPPTVGESSKWWWTKSTDMGIDATIERDGHRRVLHLNDTGGSHMFLWRLWDVAPPDWRSVTTFVVRAVSCSGECGSFFGIQALYTDESAHHVFYNLHPDGLAPGAGNGAPKYFIDATVYHRYTIVLHQGTAAVYIDGELAFTHRANEGLYHFARNGVEFGCGSSSATGEAYWDEIIAWQTWRTGGNLAPAKRMPLSASWGAIKCGIEAR